MQKDIEKPFFSLCTNEKAIVLTNIYGRLLKSCAKEPSCISQYILNQSVKMQHVSKVWKNAVVIPFPKTSYPKTFSEFRPITLTSVVMKTFEKAVRSEILQKFKQDIDPKQFV